MITLTLSPYTLALKHPLTVGKTTLRHRDGAVLALTDESGHQGFADLAPLPGLHPETLAEAMAWAGSLDVGNKEMALRRVREQALKYEAGTPASAWFAVEAAIFALEADRHGTTPAALEADEPLQTVPINALFDGTLEDAHSAIDREQLKGYVAVKVKVGRRDRETERAVLALLANELPEDTRLRIDANRSLSLTQAVGLVEGLDPARIEYVEEPLADPSALGDFHKQTGLAVALDESLRDPEAETLAAQRGITTFVLKPSLRGGLIETLSDAERATDMGKQVVISSCFESGLGLAFLAQVAAIVQAPETAAGLATDRWLKTDNIAPAFDSRLGYVDTSVWPPSLSAEPVG